MINKRVFSRLIPEILIKIYLKSSLDLENDVIIGKVINLSEDGLCLTIEEFPAHFTVGNSFELEFEVTNIPLSISSRIQWIDKGKKQVGFEFISDVHSSFKNTVREIYNKNGCGFFLIEVTAYLKDINVYGTGYFSRYFEWQGIAREEYFLTVKNCDKLMASGVKLITKHAWVEYINHCYVFDKIAIKIQNRNIKKFSFEMVFTYFNSKTRKILASGGQTLVFADNTGKLIRVPQPILDVISNHKMS